MKNQLLKLFSFTLALLCLSNLSAQESEKELSKDKNRTEIGLSYQVGEGYSLLLRQQLKEKVFLRASIKASIWGNDLDELRLGELGATLGLEFHIPLNKRWSLHHGAEIGVRSQVYESWLFKEVENSVGLSYFFGATFNVTDRFSIFGEVKHTYSLSDRYLEQEDFSLDTAYKEFKTSLNIGATFNLKNNKKKSGKIRF